MREQWDAIIIGSGVGGLVTGALLARTHGWKVLVLERHYRLGGFTHTFTRQRAGVAGRTEFEFDTGTHYIGELQPGGDLRTLLDYLTRGELRWLALPHEFEELHFEDFKWKIPGAREEHLQRLCFEFPEERSALLAYFDEERKIAEAYSTWQLAEQSSSMSAAIIRGYLRWFRRPLFETTEMALGRRFRDPRLKALLAARWMGYGVPPSESSFGMHCLHSFHYANGAWFPEGGGQRLAESLATAIRDAGGEVATRADVETILVEDGAAVGARVRGIDGANAREYRARAIVSSAGARNTYLRLLPAGTIPFEPALRASPAGESVLSLFLGLNKNPRALGFDSVNYWLVPAALPKVAGAEDVLSGNVTAFLSFPSLKRATGAHTAQLIVMARNSLFEEWRRSSAEYGAQKDRFAEKLLDLLEAKFPGLRGLVDFAELSTPRTVERFVGTEAGAVYGIPTSPARYFFPWARSRAPLRGLYLTGSDVFSPGISGAIHGGVKTFRIVTAELP